MVKVNNDNIKNDVKKLFPNIEDDALLTMIIDKLLNEISSYVNIDITDLPDKLEPTIVMCLFAWLKDNDVFENESNDPVSQISEGDTTVSFAVNAKKTELISESNLISSSLQNVLNNYRRVEW
ncbi:hypothetical protein R4B61_00370 [Fructilactobacillus vespulae]|uniref:hypothetical protein n=1 Tax=Fructilactobacillus vespulae TaxID=1249630 RepID=UPI0039B39D82